MEINKIVSDLTFAMSEQSFKDTAIVTVFAVMLILLFCSVFIANLAREVKNKYSLNSFFPLLLAITDDPIWDNSPYYSLASIALGVVFFVLLLYLPRRIKEKRKEVERK